MEHVFVRYVTSLCVEADEVGPEVCSIAMMGTERFEHW